MPPLELHQQRKILIVEPDPAIRALISALLHREGYATEAVENAPAALHARRTSTPGAVILDPRMRGGEIFLAELRADASIGAKVVIITTPDWRKPAYPTGDGIRGILLKPFFLQELVALVASCFEESSAPAMVEPRKASGSRGLQAIAPELSAGDTKLNLRFLRATAGPTRNE